MKASSDLSTSLLSPRHNPIAGLKSVSPLPILLAECNPEPTIGVFAPDPEPFVPSRAIGVAPNRTAGFGFRGGKVGSDASVACG